MLKLFLSPFLWALLQKADVVLSPQRNRFRWINDISPRIDVKFSRQIPRQRDVVSLQIYRVHGWCHNEAAVELVELVIDWPLVVDVDRRVRVCMCPVNWNFSQILSRCWCGQERFSRRALTDRNPSVKTIDK